MKKKLLPMLVLVLAALAVLAVPRPAEGSVSVSVSFFHERLSPYGQWVVAGGYGDCWVPSGVAAGWAPYVDGQWYWTDYGWTWASLDAWGDLPFHYGAWVWVDPYGWVWVPGTVWAPAWVTWAYTDAYIGWAPLPPSFVLTAGGYFGNPVVVSQSAYCFVPTRSFVGVNVASVREPSARAATLLASAAKTTRFSVSGGIVHTAGPSTSRIEKATGHRIERAAISRASTKPTTISAGGLARTSRIAVAAPASERARVLHASSKTPAKPEKAPATATRATRTEPRHETHPSTSVAEKPRHEASKPAHEQKTAQEKPAHELKTATHEHKTAPTGSASRPAVHEQKTASASHPAPKAPEPKKSAAQTAAPPEHRPETQVAHSAPKPQAAPARAQAPHPPAQKAPPPPPKPKPPEKDKEHGQGG